MITDDSQRHTEGRITWRPRRELVDVRHLDAAVIAPDIAKTFVERHHYSKTCSPTAHPFGLFYRGELVGVACYGPLASMNAHNFVFPTLTATEGVTLGRFVLIENAGYNAESWFIGRCHDLLPARGVVAIDSCADPRWGHIGQIYQATNGQHVGRTNRATIHVFEDGTELSNRTEGKARRGEVGRAYAIQQLVERGATPPARRENMEQWVERWRRALTRPMRHAGKYRYMWCLDRRRRREVLARHPDLDYPKIERAA